MDFLHNGTKIELTERGKFQAVIDGRTVNAPSLDSIKKQIDNAGKREFKTFTGLVRQGFDREPNVVTIVGVKPPRKNAWRAHHEFIDSNGRTYEDIMEDTPENRAALAEWRAYVTETRRIEKERAAAAAEIEHKVKRLSADDFAPKKPTNGSGE